MPPSLADSLTLSNRVGIEIEYTDVNIGNTPLKRWLIDNGFSVVHDASVESPSMMFSGKLVKGRTFNDKLNRDIFKKVTIGGEIVTPIIQTDSRSWIGGFDKIFSELKLAGERTNSPRGSIHVHVNVAVPSHQFLYFLLASWVLAGHFESFFYRIGSMGRPHRGENMDFIYYRPITGTYPPVVLDYRGKERFLLNYDEVLKADSYDDFFYRCGGIRDAENRYHPSRYLWINYYNMRFSNPPHLEFRVFNKTLRWDYLLAIVELCKAFVKLSIMKSYKSQEETITLDEFITSLKRIYPISPVSSLIKDSDSHFDKTIMELGIEEQIKILLYDIWINSEYVEIPNRIVYSHLERRNIFGRDDHNPPLVKDTVSLPDFYDIHRLERDDAVIFPEEP